MHVAGINFDNRPLIDTFLSTFYLNMEDNTREYIESPNEKYGLNTWDVSIDGKYLGCNLANSAGQVIPMYGERLDDGTYKFEYLGYDEYDAMGALAQFTQVRPSENLPGGDNIINDGLEIVAVDS